jgi:stage II sporulation protein D
VKPLLLVLLGLVGQDLAHAAITYKIRLTSGEGGRVVELPAEKYVAAVLAGESSTFRSREALKAMAVAARTYAAHFKARHATEGFDFCVTTHCQRAVLKDITARLTEAAEQTRGLLLWYGSQPAFAVYTRNCGGRSEAAAGLWPDIRAPYLKVHDDPYCVRHRSDAWSWGAPPEALAEALAASKLIFPEQLTQVTVLERTASSRARILQLSGHGAAERISAGSFRLAVGRALGWNTIRSDRYEVRSSGSRILFTGTGQGHGAGLCQDGADEMGAEGFTFRDILEFYYPGTSVSRLDGDIPWKRLSSDEIVLFTTRPDRERVVLQTAAAELHDLRSRWHLPLKTQPEIYVYPDMESFRNGSGEPGWVAAHTQGNRIEMQPLTVLESRRLLRSTLRHELLHVLIEARAKPGLPVWFREGLVQNLAEETSAGTAATSRHETKARVAKLIRSYGVDEVLGWVTTGLPPAVLHSSTSSSPANNK